ncbi:MAG TPA: DUF3141 domain-containing protein, partial [Vicinamibacterales bacterium]|nr:DUF3141 domain-containing protein [Vicinamibacterales bacterium]
ALGWIPATYRSTAALRKAGQRIVYLINPEVGHLGIFVSTDVARREHQAIFESFDAIERLKPGLYEMKVHHPAARDPGCRSRKYSVRFEARRVEDLRRGRQHEAFERVRQVSERNVAAYEAFVSPWMRPWGTPLSALAQKWLHPMRASRYCFSGQLNPLLLTIPWILAAMPKVPRGTAADNPWMQLEKATSHTIASALREMGRSRDASCERLFAALYGTPSGGST